MELLEKILANTFTQADLRRRLTLLKEFLEYQYFSPHEKENFIYLLNEFFTQKGLSRDDFNALLSWGLEFFNSFSRENLYASLNEIEKEVKNLPSITIYLPFAPPIYEVPKLGNWFRQNVSPLSVIDVKTDQKLIGGCALVWKGIYQDFSLRFYLERSKETIKKVISSYQSAIPAREPEGLGRSHHET